MKTSAPNHPRTIVVLNAGSSSIKAAIYKISDDFVVRPTRHLNVRERDGRPVLTVIDESDAVVEQVNLNIPDRNVRSIMPPLLDTIASFTGASFTGTSLTGGGPVAIGHRVVHGGVEHNAPVIVTPRIRAGLNSLISIAPLHQPGALEIIDFCNERFPAAHQVACFDTAFHRDHPWVADTFGLPPEFYDLGIRRYGFHGLSYESVVETIKHIPEIQTKRVIVAHLGNGASICAVKDGKSLASTMGFTPLDGLAMGTRPGQLDPGVVLYLLRERKLTIAEVNELLYHQSGLLGISGISSEMDVLEHNPDEGAQRAVEYFLHRAVCSFGEMAATLDGVDSIIFTGGIGENSSYIREQLLRRLSWLGASLDVIANQISSDEPRQISSSDSTIGAWVIPTDEELVIARHTAALLSTM